MTDGPYAHSSVTGKMAGTSVIPDFLAHWHTSGKIMFSSRSANLCVAFEGLLCICRTGLWFTCIEIGALVMRTGALEQDGGIQVRG